MTPNARWQFVLVYTAPARGEGARGRRGGRGGRAPAPSGSAQDAGLPLHHFPLEEAAEAHAAVEGSIVGKVLIDVVP